MYIRFDYDVVSQCFMKASTLKCIFIEVVTPTYIVTWILIMMNKIISM